MLVIALIDPQISKKSFQYQSLTDEYDIDVVIDSGLLIRGDRIIAGVSAKQAANPVAAIRRATFSNTIHAKAVRQGIETAAPERILVLAASRRMADKIARILCLPPVSEYINGSVVSVREETGIAVEQLNRYGKEILTSAEDAMPKRQARLLQSIGMAIGKKKSRQGKRTGRQIILPGSGELGKLVISEKVLQMIILVEAGKSDYVAKVAAVEISLKDEKISGEVVIDLKYGGRLPVVFADVRQKIEREVEFQTGLTIDALVLKANDVVIPDDLVGSKDVNPV